MEDTNDRIIEESTSLKKESNWETQILTGLIFPAGLGELMNVWKTFFIFRVKLSHCREKKENTLLHMAILRDGIGEPQFIYQALKSLGNGLCSAQCAH